jgi:hypothetical protein
VGVRILRGRKVMERPAGMVRPCLRALCEERALPSGLRGPVLWPGAGGFAAGVAAGMGAGLADVVGAPEGVGVPLVGEVAVFAQPFGDGAIPSRV